LSDTSLLVQTLDADGARHRRLYVLKSRGMAHSNQIREFRLTNRGVQLLDVYVTDSGVLVGSARAAQEARDRLESTRRRQDRERKRAMLTAQMAALKAELDAEESAMA